MSDAVTVSLFLVNKVLSFLDEELRRNQETLNGVDAIKGHLELMKAYLQDAEREEVNNETTRVLVKKIRGAAHMMEDVLDEYMIHAPRVFSATSVIQRGYEVCHNVKHWVPAHAIQDKIASINATVLEINNSPQFRNLLDIVNARRGSHNLDQLHREEAQDDEIMDIESTQNKLIKLLTEGSSSSIGPKTISVLGLSGAGKTVLVRTVYKSKKVIEQFKCQAWLSLSHTDNHEQRLQNLLTQFRMGINELHSPIEGDTAMKLRNYLEGKRYLVVLDGVSTYGQWLPIKQTLPDCFNGSRIIITTQKQGVAAKCADPDNHILHIKSLEWKDSWRLFCKKAYGNEKCPPHLKDWSDKIAKRCDGLPLAISAVGSLLSRKERKEEEWSRVHANLATDIPANRVKTLFLPSYYDLRSNQKSCLLYFSLFPEGYSIKLGRLIRLWLSEGFVENSGNEPAEKIAEYFLNDFISRKLVDASSIDVGGRVKSFRVLNQVGLFVCQKSKENKFAAVVTDQWDRAIHRRLSIENASSDLKRVSGLDLDGVRSLFMFGFESISSKMIVATLQRIRLLKVLNLENAPLDSFPKCILDASLLRYLSLRNTKVNKIPKKIKRLRYLEYLDLKQTQVTRLPEEIFTLQYLQQLLIYHCNYENRQQGVQIVGAGEMKKWPSLQKLSIIEADHNPGFFPMLGQHTLLKKLGLTNLREDKGPLLCSCINIMPNLSTLDLTSSSRKEILDLQHMNTCQESLQNLYLKGKLTSLPKWIISLNRLVRLLLKWSKLHASPTESLQDLPNLMELELTDAFTGLVLSIGSRGFPKLRTLHIEQLDGLHRIEVRNGGMPKLRKLTIVGCKKLYDLPSGIEGLKDLEELLLYDMPQELTHKLGKSHVKKIGRLIMLDDRQGKMHKG